MKKIMLFWVILFFCGSLFGQRGNTRYWQQKADYKIIVDVDVKKNQYSGSQTIKYKNNSPDTLKNAYFHLFFNAFKPNSEMDIHSRSIKDPDKRVRNRINNLQKKDQGFLKILALKQGGHELKYEIVGTTLEAELNSPIKPGDSAFFDVKFHGQVPLMVRRAGKNSPEGVALSMAQWYPKLAEYDFEGWHADPYIGREFYGVWGDFDVSITIDEKYVVGGTGYLKQSFLSNDKTNQNKKTWRFIAPKVHDFSWAADPEFIHDKRVTKNGVIINFYYKRNLSADHIKNWEQLQPAAEKLMLFFSENIGAYPYKQYSFIQGGDGGMEYGMCTFITGKRTFESLVGVAAHELAHSWFQFVLATNESKHEWMDEGFAEYYGTLAESYVIDLNKENYYNTLYKRYKDYAVSGYEQPQTTHADRFKYNNSYSVSAYVKGFLFLRQLKYLLGEDAFNRTIKKYFRDWSFKHPSPNDFIRIAEKITQAELDWYLTDWTQTTNNIDYSLKKIEKSEGKIVIRIERLGLMPMPLDLKVVFTDGSVKEFHIPLQMMRKDRPLKKGVIKLSDWPWAAPSFEFSFDYTKEVNKVLLDPKNKIADINRENNLIFVKKND